MHRFTLLSLLFLLISVPPISAQVPRSVGFNYSTYLGGELADIPVAVAYDAAGNLVVAGYTASNDFPITNGCIQQTYAGGGFDIFIAKFDPTLGTLLASTFLGGTGTDILTDMAIDGQNHILICGRSSSPDFPLSTNAVDTIHGNNQTFVSKISTNLDSLLASTMAGPTLSDPEYGHVAIAIDSNNQIIIALNSQADSFTMAGPGYQKTFSGGSDGVILKISSALDQILSSTFYGSPGNDYLFDVALSSDQKIYVTGSTNSNSLEITSSAFRDTFSGATDAIVALFSNDLTQLVGSSYYGGVLFDQAKKIETDPNGNVYIAGISWSDSLVFGPYSYDYHVNGESDIFILKINSLLTGIITGTYVGGSNNEELAELKIDNTGALYLGGSTWSDDFPIDTFSFDTSFTQSYAEGFAIKFTNNLSKLIESSYLGGSLDDEVSSIALGQPGQLTLSGWTHSADFPLDGTGYDTLYNHNTDGFLISTQLDATGIIPAEETINSFMIDGNYWMVLMAKPGIIEADYYTITGQLVYRQNFGFYKAGNYRFPLFQSANGIQLIQAKMGENIQGLTYGIIKP